MDSRERLNQAVHHGNLHLFQAFHAFAAISAILSLDFEVFSMSPAGSVAAFPLIAIGLADRSVNSSNKTIYNIEKRNAESTRKKLSSP
jgi:hypothetical protein